MPKPVKDGFSTALPRTSQRETYVHRSSSPASVDIARMSGSLAEVLLKSISVLLRLQ